MSSQGTQFARLLLLAPLSRGRFKPRLQFGPVVGRRALSPWRALQLMALEKVGHVPARLRGHGAIRSQHRYQRRDLAVRVDRFKRGDPTAGVVIDVEPESAVGDILG